MNKSVSMALSMALIAVIFVGYIIAVVSESDIKIDSYTATIRINNAGDMTVIEQWDMQYDQKMTVRFRDIVYNKYAEGYTLYIDNGNTASIDQDNISAKYIRNGTNKTSYISTGYSFNGDRDELYTPIVCEPFVDKCDSIFVNTAMAGGMYGDVSFIYEYTILGAITQYEDISELNWRMFTYAEATVEEAHIVVTLPANTLDTSSVSAWGHSLSEGTVTIASNNTVEFDMANIKKGQFPEFRILMENELFPNIRDENIVITPEINRSIIEDYEAELAIFQNQRINVVNGLLYSSFGIALIMAIIAFYIYRKYDKEFVSDFKSEYHRELPNTDPPALVSFLYNMGKISEEAITATLLNLIYRKYIKLDYNAADMTSLTSDFKLTLITDKNKDDLFPHEEYFIKWIFNKIGDGNTVTTKKIESFGAKSKKRAEEFQASLRRFMSLAKKDCRTTKYFVQGLSDKKTALMLVNMIPLGFMLLSFIMFIIFYINIWPMIIISFIVMMFYTIYVSSIKKRSKEGNELYVRWEAFKRFLRYFSQLEDYPIPGIIVWEQYLVYATVLKVADKVMEQLRIKLPEAEFKNSNTTYMGARFGNHNSFSHTMQENFQRSFTIASLNSNSTIMEARAASRASSAGRGGGFSSGGSFGGGGGGGRSR